MAMSFCIRCSRQQRTRQNPNIRFRAFFGAKKPCWNAAGRKMGELESCRLPNDEELDFSFFGHLGGARSFSCLKIALGKCLHD